MVVRPFGELSASVEWEFVGDASIGGGGDEEVTSVVSLDKLKPYVCLSGLMFGTEHTWAQNVTKKRGYRGSERTPAASHPPKMVCPGLFYLPFITSSVTASPLEEGETTDSVTGAKSADPEVDSLVRSAVPVMTEATTVTIIAPTVAIPADVGNDRSVPHQSVFGSSSSSEKTNRTLSLFTRRSGSVVLLPGGFELNDGRSCANMIDHFTPPAFFKTVREMEHEQLFVEFNVSAARNLSLSSEVRMRAEYNILEKRKWRSLAEEKDSLLGAKGSLQGEVASAKEHSGLLEQECGSLKLKATSLESIIAEKDRKLSDLGASSSSLRSQNQSLVHELETSSTDLREKLKMYEESMKRLEEFQDNLMRPLETRLAEIDADFTRCCMRFQESFHPHLLNVVAGRRWLLTHGMKLLMAKCLNSNEYMEALGNAFSRTIEKGMQEGLAAGIEHGQAGRCLTDLEAYIPSVEDDFNSAVSDLHGLNFSLLQEISNKKDASTWDIMDLLRLDDARLGCYGSKHGPLLWIFVRKGGEVEEIHVASSPFLKDVFVSLDHPLSAEALIEPPVEVPTTNALSTVVIVPHSNPSVFVEDYENPDLVDVVPKNVTPGPEGE
ncbi:hypothetical protein Tco_0654278 [Tanacetum coccineum]|uniref:Transposase (Putative), gypsy type n=1 Tax=Tanacetum coccineum TaxID=301880 RepID=A0ABQ4X2R2_9ASTR